MYNLRYRRDKVKINEINPVPSEKYRLLLRCRKGALLLFAAGFWLFAACGEGKASSSDDETEYAASLFTDHESPAQASERPGPGSALAQGQTDAEDGTFQPFDSVFTQFSGYDGYGYLQIETDPAVRNGIYFEADRYQNLSNGDQVVLTAIPEYYQTFDLYTQKTGRRPVQTRKVYTVEGLLPIRRFDPFEKLKILYDGVSPDGSITLDMSEAEEPSLSFSADRTEHLANGDSVMVRVNFRGYVGTEDYAAANGLMPDAVEKTVLLDGFSYPITDVSQIKAEAAAVLDETAERFLRKEMEALWDEDETAAAVRFVSRDLIKSPAVGLDSLLYSVYQVEYQNDTGTRKFYYYYTAIPDLVFESDGSIVLEEESVLYPGRNAKWWEHDPDAVMLDEGHWAYGFASIEDLERSVRGWFL